jgi:catechol 2,3-dioxygenase-like lactoylglutathione lyase family enzyme
VRVDHIGLTVPDLDEAVRFFCEALGATELFRFSRRDQGLFMVERFKASPESSFTLAMLSLPGEVQIELFEWQDPQQTRSYPRLFDIGGHHLCLQVDDVERALEAVIAYPGTRVLGDVKLVEPPSPRAGTRWIYFATPWGLHVELVNRDLMNAATGAA